MSNKQTVHIIDDDEAMRDSLSFLLRARGFQTLTHESAVAFLAAAETLILDCIVTDVRMPHLNGLELVGQLKKKGIACPVIVMTGHGDIALAVEAMKAGVVDFLEKPFSNEAILAAIRTALEAPTKITAADKARVDAEQRLASLTPRERDVLIGLVAGKINKVIAHELQISPRTVDVHRANLMTKTQARSLSELVRLALTAGL